MSTETVDHVIAKRYTLVYDDDGHPAMEAHTTADGVHLELFNRKGRMQATIHASDHGAELELCTNGNHRVVLGAITGDPVDEGHIYLCDAGGRTRWGMRVADDGTIAPYLVAPGDDDAGELAASVAARADALAQLLSLAVAELRFAYAALRDAVVSRDVTGRYKVDGNDDDEATKP